MKKKSNKKYFVYGLLLGFITIMVIIAILIILFRDEEDIIDIEKISIVRTLPASYSNNEEKKYWTVESCIAIENIVDYNELTFDYEITGDYDDITFKDNTMHSETTYTDKSVKFKSVELIKKHEGSATILMCYKINSSKYDGCEDLKFIIKNLTLYNSNDNKTYNYGKSSRNILCYNNLKGSY